MCALLLVLFELYQSCTILKDKLEISISTYEYMFWEIKDELIDGEMAKFTLQGDENGTFFRLQQPNDIYYRSYYPYCMKLKPSTRNEGNHTSKTFEENVLGSSQQGYQILWGNSHLTMNLPCSDFDYLDQEHYIVLCQEDKTTWIKILNKNGECIDQIQGIDQKLTIYSTNNITYLLTYAPAFAESEFNIQSVIYVYLIENMKIKSTPYFLDKKKLSDLFQNELKYFSVIDIQTFYNKLYVLDYKLGPIQLTLDEKGNFNYAKLITTTTMINEYYALVIQGVDQILVLGMIQQKMSLISLINSRFNLIRTIQNQTFQLGISKLQKTPDYYLVTSTNSLIIFDEKQIVDIISYNMFVANPDFNLYVVYNLNNIDYYEISSGILTFKKIPQTQNQMYFKLVSMNCKVDIIVQVYGKLDAKLHSNYYTDFYNQRILYYPPYPDNYYAWPSLTNGPNIQRAIKLQNNSDGIEFKALQPLIISGISQFQQNTVVFSLIKYNMGMNQYLVQSESLSAFIYDCSLTDLQQKCSQKIAFYPLIKLNEDNIQWTEVDTYDSYMGIKTQNNHVITIYRIQAAKIVQIFQIKTSLQDEKAEIIDFQINNKFVFVLLKDQTQIQIYSLSLKKQIDSITNLANAQKIYTSNYFNKNLIFIKCNNRVLIGHYSNEFNVISEITITQQLDVSLKLTIFRTTLVVVYRTSTEQGIFQYLIHNLNQVMLLRKLPLYYYQLPIKLQLASNPLKNLILITAYSAQTQTTVILVYQINEYQRNSLLTLIDTTYYFEEELNYCIVGEYDSIIQFIFKGQTFSYLFFDQPRLYVSFSTEKYQQQISLYQEEWNDFYNIRQIYQKDIVLVDMKLNLQWKPIESLEIKENQINQEIVIGDWVDGQILSYKLSCIMCTSDNDGGQIYLLNQFRKSNMQVKSKQIADIINFDENTILILTEFTSTYHYLQFVNNTGDVIKEVEVEKIQDYAAHKLYKLSANILIVVFQNSKTYQPVLKYFYCDKIFCEYKAKIQLPGNRLILDIDYHNGVMILLSNIPDYSPTIQFYLIEEYTITQLQLVLSEQYFHKKFNATALEVYQKSEELAVLILSEQTLGLVVVEMLFPKEIEVAQYNKQITVLFYQYISIPFKNFQLTTPSVEKYVQLELFRGRELEISLILLDEINESYQVKLIKNKDEYEIEIVQIFQKLGNIIKLPSISVIDNYVIQVYRHDFKIYYCLYILSDIYQITNCRAGVKISGQLSTRNFLFRKDANLKYQLLINTYEIENLLIYILEKESKIVFRDTDDIKDLKVNLMAINPYEQAQIPILIKLVPSEVPKSDMTVFFILLIVVLGVLLVGILACIIINLYLNKHRKRRRSYKTNL